MAFFPGGRRSVATLCALSALGLAAACGSSSTSSTSTTSTSKSGVTAVTVSDNGITGLPATLQPGWHTFNVTSTVTQSSNGPPEAEFSLVRPHPGVSAETLRSELATAMSQQNQAGIQALKQATSQADALGGVFAVSGTPGSFSVNLGPGNYLVMPQFTNEKSFPTQIKALQVTGNPLNTSAPQTTQTMTLVNFKINGVTNLPTGGSLLINNQNMPGEDFHQASFFRVNNGVDPNTALNAILSSVSSGPSSGPPPVTPAGGMDTLSPGQSAVLNYHLQPGTYIVACFFPDADKIGPMGPEVHAQEGMHTTITVS